MIIRLFVMELFLLMVVSFSEGVHLLPNERQEFFDSRTSIIVPCRSRHAKFIPSLLDHYSKQTILPDEMVISLSGVKHLDDKTLYWIKNKKAEFPVKFLLHYEDKCSSFNRNAACYGANNNIIICQDADDIPHRQRIEIVRSFFEKYDIYLLLHAGWHSLDESKLNKSIYKEELNYYLLLNPEGIMTGEVEILNGPNAFLSDVFKEIKYKEYFGTGEDKDFNKRACIKHGAFVVTNELYLYRYGVQ